MQTPASLSHPGRPTQCFKGKAVSRCLKSMKWMQIMGGYRGGGPDPRDPRPPFRVKFPPPPRSAPDCRAHVNSRDSSQPHVRLRPANLVTTKFGRLGHRPTIWRTKHQRQYSARPTSTTVYRVTNRRQHVSPCTSEHQALGQNIFRVSFPIFCSKVKLNLFETPQLFKDASMKVRGVHIEGHFQYRKLAGFYRSIIDKYRNVS